jgi:hypothetical protein
MFWRGYERIVVNIENSTRRIGSVFQKCFGFHHCISCSVIAKRLYLQPVVIKENFTSCALVYLVSVDIKTTTFEDVTKPKVIAAHCRMVTEVKRLNMLRGKVFANEQSGALVIKYDTFEAVTSKRLPAVETLLDIVGKMF